MKFAVIGVAALLLWPAAARLEEAHPCPHTKLPPMALPRLSDAVHHNKDVHIIAFGSSSTIGTRASDEHHTYPAVLLTDLVRALPDSHVDMTNRGIGGQDADEMLARIRTDVLEAAPTLVIWQLGANGAMRRTDPAAFEKEVDDGIQQMEAVGADVILMDNQRSPMILASPDHARIDQALADAAKQGGARLFARGQLMQAWQDEGHPYAEFLSDDGVHHNDLGYACIAHALATSIVEGLGSDTRNLHAAQ